MQPREQNSHLSLNKCLFVSVCLLCFLAIYINAVFLSWFLCFSGGCLLCMLCFLHELFPLIEERKKGWKRVREWGCQRQLLEPKWLPEAASIVGRGGKGAFGPLPTPSSYIYIWPASRDFGPYGKNDVTSKLTRKDRLCNWRGQCNKVPNSIFYKNGVRTIVAWNTIFPTW